jgi:DNA-binding CsgD family transcriptional regulator/tetratricopeptide (TPR) repeat protein
VTWGSSAEVGDQVVQPTGLLERDRELGTLRDAAASAAVERRGSVVLLAGEAGIGKSSLVQTWAEGLGGGVRVLVGWCDDFLTRRPLGPLHDIARATADPLREAITRADTSAVLDAMLVELDHPLRATALVLEDVHWADEATLDVVRYVGRRIERLPALLVLTYRDDAVDADHPLHGVIATLPRGVVHRTQLRPLSASAVSMLTANTPLDAAEVARVTAGNPFFVTEILREGGRVPASVADAVRAQVQTLPTAARSIVERLSILPAGADRDLLQPLGVVPEALAAAEARGVLVVTEHEVRFRHELARLAVQATLPAATRIGHHEAVLDRLLSLDREDTELLHHAMEAGRGEVVADRGPRAAHQAFRAGANREAASHQRNVLAYAHLLEPTVHAQLLEEQAWTLYNLHRFDEAVLAAEAAVAVRAELGDPVAHGRALTVLSRMRFLANEPEAAIATVEAAAELLDREDDEEVRVEGLVARAVTYAMVEHPAELAMQLTERAVHVTSQLDRSDLRSLALNYRAVSLCAGGGTPDLQDFHEAIRLALQGGHLELAARAYANLTFELLLSREPSQATLPLLAEALAFCEDHDFPSHAFDVRARQAAVVCALGRWEEAERDLRALRETSEQRGLIDLIALESLARIAVRRGDEDADAVLEGAWKLAVRSGAAPYIGLIGVIRLERAWLHAAPDAAACLADLPLERLRPRLRAEALRYAQLAGLEVDVPPDVAEPWASGLRGCWETAAAAWRADQRPYELAVELLASDEVGPTLEALRLFDDLGAAPAARLGRQRLREQGVRRVPRGPQPATREHPAGLTARQAEVLDRLSQGLTNVQIADELVLSVRTVDHHVAAVLQKLGVSSRQEAAARAATLDPGWR